MSKYCFILTQHKGEINFVVPLLIYLRNSGIAVDIYCVPQFEDYGNFHYISQAINEDYLGILSRLCIRTITPIELYDLLGKYDYFVLDHGSTAASSFTQ